jgi:hypothetical protein
MAAKDMPRRCPRSPWRAGTTTCPWLARLAGWCAGTRVRPARDRTQLSRDGRVGLVASSPSSPSSEIGSPSRRGRDASRRRCLRRRAPQPRRLQPQSGLRSGFRPRRRGLTGSASWPSPSHRLSPRPAPRRPPGTRSTSGVVLGSTLAATPRWLPGDLGAAWNQHTERFPSWRAIERAWSTPLQPGVVSSDEAPLPVSSLRIAPQR